MNRSNQVVGNIGMYYVCYRLSELGFNVMPTARNAKGIDFKKFGKTDEFFEKWERIGEKLM